MWASHARRVLKGSEDQPLNERKDEKTKDLEEVAVRKQKCSSRPPGLLLLLLNPSSTPSCIMHHVFDGKDVPVTCRVASAPVCEQRDGDRLMGPQRRREDCGDETRFE